ncbi:MAG: hypothetical protein XXXJIFNMEKO3_LKCDNKCA_00073 (plasmid) [Candidatus Erwinia impunctatus]
MKVIIGALGSSGDVYPCIEIGAILKKRHHEVYLLANEHFKSSAVSRGLSFMPVGDREDYLRTVKDRRLWDKKTALKTLSGYMAAQQEEMYNAMAAFIEEDCNCIIIHSLWCFAASIVSDKFGVRKFSVSLTNATQKLKPGRLISFLEKVSGASLNWKLALFKSLIVSPALQDTVNTLRMSNGLAGRKNIYAAWTDDEANSVVLYEPWFYKKNQRKGFYAGFLLNNDSECSHDTLVSSFIDRNTVVIFTSWALADDHFVNQIVSDIKEEGMKCVIVTPEADIVHAEHRVLMVPFINISKIRGCLFAVHHGGIGTTAQLLSNGVPQLIYPSAFDQFGNAITIERLRCGLRGRGRGRKQLKAMAEFSRSGRNHCEHFAALFNDDTSIRNSKLESFLRLN